MRVLVTRQILQNQLLTEKINSLGWATALPCPLLEIVTTIGAGGVKPLIDSFTKYDLAIFTSPNAVTAAIPLISGAIGQQPKLAIAAIGAATANVLKKYTCQQVIVPRQQPFNSENLLSRLATFNFAQGAVIIFTGEHGHNLIASSLREQGIEVTCISCYRRDIPPNITPLLESIVTQGNIDAILITCETSLNALTAAAHACMPSLLTTSKLIVASQRIMDAALRLCWKQVYLAKGASDNDMLTALEAL